MLECWNETNAAGKYEKFGKRLLDIVASLGSLLVLSPLFILVSVLIKIGSPGPIFFLQERIGRGGNNFKLIKFRSMYTYPDQEKEGFNPGDETRITRLGKFLRKTKIDELPALFNVSRGDMSIVGPRPEVGKYVRLYGKDFEAALQVRPGLSDFASIKYRDEESILVEQSDPEKYYIETILPDKLSLAKQYVQQISFKIDMRIIRDTLRSIVN